MTQRLSDHAQDYPLPQAGGGGRERPPLACYANYFEVGHNAFEFLLDAGQVEPQSGAIQLLSRIAVSPVHAKLLAQLLNQSIAQFEQRHHEIPDLSEGAAQPDLAFTSPHEFERLAMDARRRPAPPDSQFSTKG